MSNTTGRRKALSLIAAGALALAGLGAATIPALAENDEGVAVDVATAPVGLENATTAPVDDGDATVPGGGGDGSTGGATDYCDANQRPSGVSVAQWLASAPAGANTDCIDVHYFDVSCGYVYISMTSRVKPYTYQMEYRMVDTAGRPYGEARTLPNEGLWFDEDENGGSVRIGAYIGGLEEAYIQFAGPDDLQWKSPGRSITIKTDCQTVNYCDPSQRPNGLSIAEWLATAPGDSKIKCMTVGEPVITCGAIDIPFASSVVGLDYQIEYWELDADGKAVGRAKIMPEGGLTFAEGHNNGSVTIQAYVGGPEQDYVGASGVGTFRYPGEQFTVKTTCETTPPTEPPTEKPTEPPTEPATEPATEKPTEKPTEGTGTPSEKPTEKPTEGTGTPTEKPSDKPTSGAATPSVKPSAGAKLPSTGSDTAPLAASALLMLGLGAVAVAARARRTAQ